MILKALVQLVAAAGIVGIMPVDAAALELQVGKVATSDPLFAAAAFTPGPFLPLAKTVVPAPPIKSDSDSYGIVTTAASVIVQDAGSGEVLFAKRPEEVRAIGSISKLMTALVYLDTQPDLDQRFTQLEEDFAGGGRVYLYYRDPLTLRDILGAMMVGSDNTATMTIVRASGLSKEDFIARMNSKAAEMGLTNTHFEDPTGLSANNVSTAEELVVLLAAARQNDVLAGYMRTDTYVATHSSGRSVSIPSTDLLLSSAMNTGDYRVTAGKTGYIPQAGYCLATEIREGGHEIFVVVLGAPEKEDRFTDAIGLSSWAFKTFTWPDEL